MKRPRVLVAACLATALSSFGATVAAVQFIPDSKDEPFFLYLPHTVVHLPHLPAEKFRGTSDDGAFGDWVAEMDWSVGEVFEALRVHGLDEKTLVIFTSDNGPWIGRVKDVTTAGPLRGGKGSTLEGGVRVPTIARWPGRIPAGTASDAVCGTIDLLPTFVTLAGGTVPSEPVVDGLRRLALAMQAELGDQAAPGRRPAGRVEHPTTLYPVKESPAAAEPVKKAARR